mgnify:CR=1 FL=1
MLGWKIAQLFWRHGISKTQLQFIPYTTKKTGLQLIKNKYINGIMLTGSTNTADTFLKHRPSLDLMAETGGKNTIIVTAHCDRDNAIMSIIKSAFSHSGQKCSACSLVICESEVYQDTHFITQLKEAVISLICGTQWDTHSFITPLVKPNADLLAVVKNSRHEKNWLLRPYFSNEEPTLLYPGIKRIKNKDDIIVKKELFGPIIGLMEASSLEEAITLANQSDYGLTAGLESLNKSEQLYWKAHIKAGNLYINRPITGAIVGRQPFGGQKKSKFGNGFKAGGPHYLMGLVTPQESSPPKTRTPHSPLVTPILKWASKSLTNSQYHHLKSAARSYTKVSKTIQHPQLLAPLKGEDNYYYMSPLKTVVIGISSSSNYDTLLLILMASLILKIKVELVSSKPIFSNTSFIELLNDYNIQQSYETNVVTSLTKKPFDMVRLISPPSHRLLSICHEYNIKVVHHTPYFHGQLELPFYCEEISVSHRYHRYGYTGIGKNRLY